MGRRRDYDEGYEDARREIADYFVNLWTGGFQGVSW